ncbi:hypothetical protein ACPA54_37630 [Uniformispora flossi]|uniref:hypothetical protein n=1 Tax=Uniformispora flossi TaxID=3390723 RepID=UPI003C2C399F
MPIRKPPPVLALRPTADLRDAEAVLIARYPQLVRLAYVILPPALGRHGRVVAAHRLVQRALPGGGLAAWWARVRDGRGVPGSLPERGPGQPDRRDGAGDVRRVSTARGEAGGAAATADPADGFAFGWVRARVVAAALAESRRSEWWPRPFPGRGPRRPGLPGVWGLRLTPGLADEDELPLLNALSDADPATRAAFALCCLDGLDADGAADVLDDAGADDTAAALAAAERIAADFDVGTEVLLASPEFDPCQVRAYPTDLLRRRRRVRVTALAAAAACIAALTVGLADGGGGSGGEDPVAPAAVRGSVVDYLVPERLIRAAPEAWADTSRVDFTAWSARGTRIADRPLLARALDAWRAAAAPGTRNGPRPALTPGTTAALPPADPRLLYAGDVDSGAGIEAVVMLFDGQRVVRYAETADRVASLQFALVDDADVTTAAALVLTRSADRVRYLLAPWVASAGLRDLLRPDGEPRPLRVAADGATEPVPVPTTGAPGLPDAQTACRSWPVLQLRSSDRIAERHAFLVGDLGDPSPVHLTYNPLPGPDNPARAPREALSPAALTSWAANACGLGEMRGRGIRAVDLWDFAEQTLPEAAGRATWECVRADTWRGPGSAAVVFRGPGEAEPEPLSRADDTALCSRFGQRIVAGRRWQAPSGRRYFLAAASRGITHIDATGALKAAADGTVLATPLPAGGAPGVVELTAKAPEGEAVRGKAG